MFQIGLHHALELRHSILVLGDPVARKGAILDIGEDSLHCGARRVVDNTRARDHVAPGRGIADELVHFGEPTFVQEINNELQFVHDFVVGDLRLVARFAEGLETGNDEFGCTTTKNSLLTEQVGLGFLGKSGFNYAGPGTTDSGGVGQCLLQCISACVLVYCDEARHTVTFFVLAAYQPTRAFGRDESDIQVCARLDLAVVHGEAVRKEQQGAIVDVIYNSLVERFLHHVRRQEHDNRRAFDCLVGFLDGQAVGFCICPARAALAQSDNDVKAGVLEVKRVGAALATVTEDGNLLVRENRYVYICFRIHLHGVSCALNWSGKKKPHYPLGCGAYDVRVMDTRYPLCLPRRSSASVISTSTLLSIAPNDVVSLY